MPRWHKNNTVVRGTLGFGHFVQELKRVLVTHNLANQHNWGLQLPHGLEVFLKTLSVKKISKQFRKTNKTSEFINTSFGKSPTG